MEWIKKLIPSLGLLIGIIFVAVGATMTLSSGVKLAFNVSDGYVDYYDCDYKWNPQLEREVELSEEDSAACKIEAEERAQERFVAQRVSDLINGGAFLAVGIFFWIFFWKRQDS